ncbi:MAG: pyruvate kinase, partial [Clostridia bacterium]|nr:pyruvate kinase [Clostridia bacterium]
GLDHIEEIVDNSAGIMIGRGDLGVEIPFQQVPIAQKDIIKICNRKGKVVITATQMLESMTHSPRPTRAEVSDVANAIYDRTGAIMLSGECAMGDYPVECVKTMVDISEEIENEIKYWERFNNKYQKVETDDLEYNINYAVCRMARKINAKAVVAYTNTGDTARYLSGLGIKCPVFAVTSNEKTYNQLALVWNVFPILLPEQKTIDDLLEVGIEKLEEKGHLVKGDRVIIAGGSHILPSRSNSKTIGGIVEI